MEQASYIRKNELLVNESIQNTYKKIIWLIFSFIIVQKLGIFQVSALATYILVGINLVCGLMVIYAHKIVKRQENIKWIILCTVNVAVGTIYGMAYANVSLL